MADVQTNLRLPAELKEALLAAATRNNRSLSAEVIFRLAHSFSEDAGLLQPSEPEELRRERGNLLVRLDVALGRLSTLEALEDMNRSQMDALRKLGYPGNPSAMEHEGVNLRRQMRPLQEQIDGINARLREIDQDLQLPGIPAAVTALADRLPR